ncbi:MAG: CoA-transferase [Azospirillaceae bacterium]
MARPIPTFISDDEAAALVPDGAVIALGGWVFHQQPMSLVRALVRRSARHLTLIPAPGSIAPDLLIGAGCASALQVMFISFEELGMAPHFRRAAEAASIAITEIDGPAFAGGLRAAASGLPWMPIPDLGTDLPRVSPQVYRRLDDGSGLLSVPAIVPDIALLHAQQADEQGNIQYFGGTAFDILIAQAARTTIVSVDRVVSSWEAAQATHLTRLPRAFVDHVVAAPFGAHPTSSAGLYRADEDALSAYCREAASADDPREQTLAWAGSSADDYTDRIPGARLAALTQRDGIERTVSA